MTQIAKAIVLWLALFLQPSIVVGRVGNLHSKDVNNNMVGRRARIFQRRTQGLDGGERASPEEPMVFPMEDSEDGGEQDSLEEPLMPMEDSADVALTPPPVSNFSSIVEIATGNDDFSTLVLALTAAGLVEALTQLGPFTVFAPTNAAFDAANVGYLLEPEWSNHLQAVLLYHVASGTFTSPMLEEGQEIITLYEEQSLTVTSLNPFSVNDVTVDPADIRASNGVVHVVQEVLFPPFVQDTIPVVASSLPDSFSTLVDLLTLANLTEALDSGVVTVFAPTNDAFAKIDEETLAFLTSPEGIPLLEDILLYHVVPGIVYSEAVEAGDQAMTFQGENITVTSVGEVIILNGVSTVIVTDVLAANGVIHVIDTVLIPPEEPTDMPEEPMTLPAITQAPSMEQTGGATMDTAGTMMPSQMSGVIAVDLVIEYYTQSFFNETLADGDESEVALKQQATTMTPTGMDTIVPTPEESMMESEGDSMNGTMMDTMMDTIPATEASSTAIPDETNEEVRRRLQEVEEDFGELLPTGDEIIELVDNTYLFLISVYTEAFNETLLQIVPTEVEIRNVTEGFSILYYQIDLNFSAMPAIEEVVNVTLGIDTEEYILEYVRPSGPYFNTTEVVVLAAVASEGMEQTEMPTIIETEAPADEAEATEMPTDTIMMPTDTTPTVGLTMMPTGTIPSASPTAASTDAPTMTPTMTPTMAPTIPETETPSEAPTELPTIEPVEPTLEPTLEPTILPTMMPSVSPSLLVNLPETPEPTTIVNLPETPEPTSGCPGRTARVIGTILFQLDSSQELTEPTEDQIVEIAQFVLRDLGSVLQDTYGSDIRGFSATIDETDTSLDGAAFPLEFDATILFAECAPPAEEVNAIFEDADYPAILGGFEPTGQDNVFQFVTGEASYTGETTIEP